MTKRRKLATKPAMTLLKGDNLEKKNNQEMFNWA
jgi:hypothetical protein